MVTRGADISVVARGLVQGADATALGVAVVIGTGFIVVAVHETAERACSVAAVVHECARILVVTGSAVWSMDTALRRLARIVGAGITIVARKDDGWQAAGDRVT